MLSIPAVREIAGLLRQSFDLLREHVAIQCILFRKSAQKNWAVCVHRDRILPARSVLGGEYVGEKEGMSSYRFPDGLLHRLIIARLSLNHVPEGDIVVTPGSHDWSSANRPREKVPVFVPKGGVLLMKPLLLHGSKRLSISEERCVLHFVFAPRDLPAQWCYTA